MSPIRVTEAERKTVDMSDEISRISNGGMTVSITSTNGMQVTADTDLRAGATWKTSETSHLTLQSAIGGFLNASLDRAWGEVSGIDYNEIGCSSLDLRIAVGPEGVELIHVGDSGEVVRGEMKEMGVDLLIEYLIAYKKQRDSRLSKEVPQ